MQARGCKPNKKEILLLSFLEQNFLGEWLYVGDGSCPHYIKGGKCPDFVSVRHPFLIELFGNHWHRDQNPQERIDHFAHFGYKTLIVWEKELRNIPSVLQRVNEMYADYSS